MSDQIIRKQIIGLTEPHGMAQEQALYPPEGYEYKFLKYKKVRPRLFQSPLKGFMSSFYDDQCDFIEAILTPAITKKPWFYSLARFEEAVTFSVFGIPTPRSLRIRYIRHLFERDNFRGMLFWSQAGLDTVMKYGKIRDQKFLDKCHVVYPGIAQASPEHIQFGSTDRMQLLFNGNFFIKGGANLVDVFEQIQPQFPELKLRLCCDIDIDFHTPNTSLRNEYLRRIAANPAIEIGRVSRDTFTKKILKETDIYVLPTYADAFGFAALEAMSYGVPVISTNFMALPEIVEHEKCGFLIDISRFDCNALFRGCLVSNIPDEFRKHVNTKLKEYLITLLESESLRRQFGTCGVNISKERFSFRTRQQTAAEIYNKYA